ncbi:BREX-2 system phosphatase PglZ [Streptomyces tubbatahanensis]|uniref:BREX-2 system phosphatase PglZ n=1 Tax=Streptomyces tubbatahanensis TaxID=2923272 RepID=A0ABY3XVB6_9ACTN|nr:BREX-2 system phosphatase PglZ [Streptomyces tubbatahanensis]UNS98183.1 BREX-2 system phosphatase PglZ [Streptomyces tubbatahanensis]
MSTSPRHRTPGEAVPGTGPSTPQRGAGSAGAVRLKAPTVAQYLASQSGLTPGKRRVVLLRAAPVWDFPAELFWGEGRQATVVAALSPLAVYELVLTHQAPKAVGPDVLAVLTDREDAELGPDLMARVYKQRVHAVNSWDVVREAFGASGRTDQALTEEHWAAEALLDAAPPGGWAQLAGGQLSRPVALTALALRRLGIGRYAPEAGPDGNGAAGQGVLDVHALLRWSLTSGGPERYLGLRVPERRGLAGFLSEPERAGLAGRALLSLIDAERGPDAVAFGLVCAALWAEADDSVQGEVHRARGRAERWFGDEPPAHGPELDALVTAFGRSCEEFVSGLLLTARSGSGDEAEAAHRLSSLALDRAAVLVRQFGAETAAGVSDVLTAGLEARFTTAGRALSDGDPDLIARAVDALTAHRLASRDDTAGRVGRVLMAQRLTRWLATGPVAGCARVPDGIDRHIDDTGWVDLAHEHIEAGGDPDPTLAAAYDTLCAAVRESRRALDREFAATLATWTASGAGAGSMLTVETFLPQVVAPVVKAGGRRVLLLVLDGMSAAIAGELADELRRDWAEYDPLPKAKDTPRRRGMAAALPTLTSVSRTSLFAAALTAGTQADERRIFPAHPFWGGEQVAVFHKDDLRAESGGGTLGPELREALTGDRTHVAVVLNTIDDRLAKELKFGEGSWRAGQVGGLQELLRVARAQGRAVIITSDHGHVIDRHSTKVARPHAQASDVLSARHRAAGDPLAEGEITLSGPRVLTPEPGGEIVALWDADTRYTAQKAGYHGGASLAEFVIPVLAFLPFGAEKTPPGWRELGDPHPAWWSGSQSHTTSPGKTGASEGASAPATATAPRKPKPSGRGKNQDELARGHDTLFQVEWETSPDAETLVAPTLKSPDDALVASLLDSEIFGAQVTSLARKPDLPRVEKALHVLLEAGGTLPVTALAQRIGLPGTRSPGGFAAVLRQLLNHDGVQALETLPDGRTLRLHRELLRDQFELE